MHPSPFVTLIAAAKETFTRNLLRHYKQNLDDQECVYFVFTNTRKNLVAINSVIPSRCSFVRGDFSSIATTVLTLVAAMDAKDLKLCFVFDNMVCQDLAGFTTAILDLREAGISSIVLTTKASVIQCIELDPTVVCSSLLHKTAKKALIATYMVPNLDLTDVSVHRRPAEVAKAMLKTSCTKDSYLVINTVESLISSQLKSETPEPTVSMGVSAATPHTPRGEIPVVRLDKLRTKYQRVRSVRRS